MDQFAELGKRWALICLILEQLREHAGGQGTQCREEHLQLALYLARDMFKISLLEEYEFTMYHSCGFYSDELGGDLAIMERWHVLQRDRAAGDHSYRFQYHKTTVTEQAFAECKKRHEAMAKFIAENFAGRSEGYLIMLTSAHWVTEEWYEPVNDYESQLRALQKLKPRISDELANKAVTHARQMAADALRLMAADDDAGSMPLPAAPGIAAQTAAPAP